jgi:transcriptional regulator with XRE-family HTH domain
MKKQAFNIDQVLKSGRLNNEFQYQQAVMAHRSMRNMSQADETMKAKRQQLRDLILEYEQRVWDKGASHEPQKIEQSDLAEEYAEKEADFIQNRKHLIREKLEKLNLTQQQFGSLLGHDSKTYMSELMNGVRPFTISDLILIHHLLKIPLEDLIPPFVSPQQMAKVQEALSRLPRQKPQLNEDWSLTTT